jgi:hypothetical protein
VEIKGLYSFWIRSISPQFQPVSFSATVRFPKAVGVQAQVALGRIHELPLQVVVPVYGDGGSLILGGGYAQAYISRYVFQHNDHDDTIEPSKGSEPSILTLGKVKEITFRLDSVRHDASATMSVLVFD